MNLFGSKSYLCCWLFLEHSPVLPWSNSPPDTWTTTFHTLWHLREVSCLERSLQGFIVCWADLSLVIANKCTTNLMGFSLKVVGSHWKKGKKGKRKNTPTGASSNPKNLMKIKDKLGVGKLNTNANIKHLPLSTAKIGMLSIYCSI